MRHFAISQTDEASCRLQQVLKKGLGGCRCTIFLSSLNFKSKLKNATKLEQVVAKSSGDGLPKRHVSLANTSSGTCVINIHLGVSYRNHRRDLISQ